MIRGTTHFACDDCGDTFQALDIEYAATALSVPHVCPNCGSAHTYPISLIGIVNKSLYRKIWQKIDKNKKH